MKDGFFIEEIWSTELFFPMSFPGRGVPAPLKLPRLFKSAFTLGGYGSGGNLSVVFAKFVLEAD